ncbi:unnamed protein product [Rhodiola kirilowii]
MGTKVQYKNYLPGGYHPMGDLNDDSNNGTWPVMYGDKPSSNGQCHDPYSQSTIADAYFGYHTEAVKQKILEHEAIFRTQLYELHRLYKVQIDLMDELKMNELQRQSMATETSISSCSASQRQDAQRWHTALVFPPSSSASAKPAIVGEKDFNSTPSFLSKSLPNGLVSASNAGGSKDCDLEILECRPSKARRKFNLELRADEYIDIEEPNFNSKRPLVVSSYPSNGICDDPPSSRTKMFLAGSAKIDSGRDGARLNNGENGLAELNEQIHIQGPNSSSLNFVGCDSNYRSNQQLSSKSQLQTFPREFMKNSHHGREDSRSRNLTMAQNGMQWSPHMLDPARSKGQTTTFSYNLVSEKINMFNKGQPEYLKERYEIGQKHYANGIDFFNSSHQLDKSFPTWNAPWEKSGSCITQKSATAEIYRCFNSTTTLPQSLQSSSKTSWTAGQRLQMNSDSGKDSAYQNGFDKGSCSGSGPARYPPTCSDYSNRGNSTYMTSGHTFCQNESINVKGLNNADASSAKGIDLNIASIGGSHDSNRPSRDHAADLPWLKSNTGLKNGTNQAFNSSVTRQIIGSGSSGYDTEAKPTSKQIMGVPIFEESHSFKGSSSCRSSIEEMDKHSGRGRGFDMNLPYESEEKETTVVSGRNLIDLNMCLIEDDAVMTTSTLVSRSEKTNIGFDLEAPCETEEDDLIQLKRQKPECIDEDLVTCAAEAIICIRKLTLTETPAGNSKPVALKWFVDVIAADKCGDSAEETESIDYFEYMTLLLPETKADEYLPDYPKPPKPEEQTGAGLYTTRTRKGQARRCRPRRDFQRDILPGLTSLARHEVTEDLQTFGGLMRAMGHSWQSGLTRRAGPRRGRPRLTPLQSPTTNPSPVSSPLPPKASSPSLRTRTITTTITNELIGMEDHRSLTGWGKTTRRPRRQRCCPTGSNASIVHIA